MKNPSTITPYTGPGKLVELYQTSGLRFAFLSAPRDGNQLCHPWIKCKDYLHDMVRAAVLKTTAQVHGLNYSHGTGPQIDTRRIRLVVKEDGVKAKDLHKKLRNGVAIINEAEGLMGINGRTKARRYTEEGCEYVVLNGPGIWLKSPILTSIFPLLLRLAAHPKIGDVPATLNHIFTNISADENDARGNDVQFAKELHGKLAAFFANYKDLALQGNNQDPVLLDPAHAIGSYHNSAGCMSFFRGQGYFKDRALALADCIKNYKEAGEALPHVKSNYDVEHDAYMSETSPNFQFVKVIGEGLYATVGTTTACREFMIRDLSKSLKKEEVILDKFRVALHFTGVNLDEQRAEKIETSLFKVKEYLNHIEKTYGLKRTNIQRVLVTGTNGKKRFGWLVVGSPVWAASPVTMNILITLLRSLHKYNLKHTLPEEANDKTLQAVFKKTIQDTCWVKHADGDVFRKWGEVQFIMTHWKKLFKKKDVAQHYQFENENYRHIYDELGVTSYLNKGTRDKKLLERVTEIKVKEAKSAT